MAFSSLSVGTNSASWRNGNWASHAINRGLVKLMPEPAPFKRTKPASGEAGFGNLEAGV